MTVGIIDDEEMECCFEISGTNNGNCSINLWDNFHELRTSFTCVCCESAGNMIEKIIVTCGSPIDASGWVEALGKDQAQVTVMNGPSSKSQITQVCCYLLMLGNCVHVMHLNIFNHM